MSTPSTSEEQVSVNQLVGKHGLRSLLGAHQHLADVMSRHSNVYFPLIYDPPKEANNITNDERRAVEMMLRREVEIVEKLKRLLEAIEANHTDLIRELSPWTHTGWNTD